MATPFIFVGFMSLSDIKNRVQHTEKKFSKTIGNTKIIAVSKVQPIHRIKAVLQSGHRIFGENRIQEAQSKWPEFKQQYDNVKLHIIGPLQSNKTRAAMELADSIHTVDRLKLAKNMARIAQDIGRCPELFVQVNTGEEEQKSGVLPSETELLVKECLDMDLPIKGLMCIPPINEEASLHFALLKKLSENCGLKELSWGCLLILKKQLVLVRPIFVLARPSLVIV